MRKLKPWLIMLVLAICTANCAPNGVTSLSAQTKTPINSITPAVSLVLPSQDPTDVPSIPSPSLTALPAASPTPISETDPALSAGQWNSLVYHEGLRKVVLINGGPERGSKPAEDPLELWEWAGGSWLPLSLDGPTWRNWAAVAYDSAREALVIHGGNQRTTSYDETLEWTDQAWIEHVGGGPGAREGAGMAYDAARGITVLFGGALGLEVMGDTWEWDGEMWNQVAVSGPPLRFNADMAYDPFHERVLLYGGHYVPADPGDGEVIFYGDFWAWEGQSWEEIPMSEPNPGVRIATSLVPDPETGQMLMFGGAGGTEDFFTDLWGWDGSSWMLLSGSGTPPRSGHHVVYDPVREVFVLFGGVDHPGGPVLDETWEWDRQEWTCPSGCE